MRSVQHCTYIITNSLSIVHLASLNVLFSPKVILTNIVIIMHKYYTEKTEMFFIVFFLEQVKLTGYNNIWYFLHQIKNWIWPFNNKQTIFAIVSKKTILRTADHIFLHNCFFFKKKHITKVIDIVKKLYLRHKF